MSSPLQRRSFVLVASTIIAGVLGYAGYSQFRAAPGAEAEAGASGQLAVETSSFYVTVANRGVQALSDVRVAIEPAGRTAFTTRIVPRLEAGERRNLSLNDFRSADGTALNLRVHRPRHVSVTARAAGGEEVNTRVPWR